MCYFNSQVVQGNQQIRLQQLEKLSGAYDFLDRQLQVGFDYNMNAVIRPSAANHDIELVQMEWGFIPRYLRTREDVFKMRNGYKDAAGKYHPGILTLNAVCEELLMPGKIYRDAALHRRCLVLSSGFFEWRHLFPLNKRSGLPLKTAIKYPYFIRERERPYFFMAGVWQPWTDASTGEYVESFAIITTRANPLMEQVHNSKKRMPAILTEELAYEWLFGQPDEKRILELAATQCSSGEMVAYPVAKDFREALEPSKPFHYTDLPPLAAIG